MTVTFGRFDGVELCKAGTWNASTGRVSITPDDIAAAVTAFADRAVDRAPIKLGHDAKNTFNSALTDGTPAFGWVENVRASADGQSLIGDLVGIPKKLAEVIPTAFARRSVELAYGVRTAAGQVYRCVLTGLALLGAAPPAVKGLEELLALFCEEPLHTVCVEISDTPSLPPVALSAADGADNTGRPADTKGTSRMKLTKEQLAGFGLAENATDDEIKKALTDAGLAVLPAAPAENPPAGGAPAAPASTPPAAPTGEATPPAAPAAPAGAPAGEPTGTPVAASAAPTIPVDATVWAESQARLAAAETQLADIKTREDKTRRDALFAEAIRTGRISASADAAATREHYRKLLDSDEAGTTALFASMPAARTAPVGPTHGHAFSGVPQISEDEAKARTAAAARSFGLNIQE